MRICVFAADASTQPEKLWHACCKGDLRAVQHAIEVICVGELNVKLLVTEL